MSYSDWRPVIQAAYLRRIPFCTTDYTEEIVENQIDMTPVILSWARIPAPPIEKLKFQMNPFQTSWAAKPTDVQASKRHQWLHGSSLQGLNKDLRDGKLKAKDW